MLELNGYNCRNEHAYTFVAIGGDNESMTMKGLIFFTFRLQRVRWLLLDPQFHNGRMKYAYREHSLQNLI